MSKELFLVNMKLLLGAEEYKRFAASLQEPAFRGIYVNTLKCTVEKLQQLFPYPLRQTPFSEKGFYIAPDVQHLGNHPLHHAGAFYVQEPSAMSAAAVLDVQPGDRVLDLCAAPGGKTTALAGVLAGTGLLWSNEYVKQRAFTLLSNCERIGVRNAVVSNADTRLLAEKLPTFFNKILVDAPCSGEGMLRREKAEYEKWSEENIAICAARQKNILENAAVLLCPGGEMVYSTCTFNQEENEEVVAAFLEKHPEFSLVHIAAHFGSAGFGMPQARRIFPKDGGEGHFVAKLKKSGSSDFVNPKSFTAAPAPSAFHEFYREQFLEKPYGNPCQIRDKTYLLPPEMPALTGIPLLRAGVLAGEMKGARFVPAHALYEAAQANDCANRLNLTLDDARTAAFLHGEEIDIGDSTAQKGFCAVSVENIPLGFGKVTGSKLKNHYPKGLRNLS